MTNYWLIKSFDIIIRETFKINFLPLLVKYNSISSPIVEYVNLNIYNDDHPLNWTFLYLMEWYWLSMLCLCCYIYLFIHLFNYKCMHKYTECRLIVPR